MKLRYYIEDLIYGANDGIITTFAIVAGVIGAGLEPKTILIIGLANVFADGFSMATSDYLGRTSEQEVAREDGAKKDSFFLKVNPKISAFLTFFSFVFLGLVPLIPYAFLGDAPRVFEFTIYLTALALFLVGALRSLITKRSFFRQGIEVLFVGGIAATIAYVVGLFVSNLIP
jgi:VIT1/CCC1 family predicted Fe2+/Mn2+ transporter